MPLVINGKTSLDGRLIVGAASPIVEPEPMSAITYNTRGTQHPGAELQTAIPTASGNTFTFKFKARSDSYTAYQSATLFSNAFPASSSSLIINTNGLFAITGGSATLDGSPIVSNSTAAPLDGIEHEIVFTYASASNILRLFGKFGRQGIPMYDLTLVTSTATYHWPATDQAQTLQEENFGTNNIIIGSGYNQSYWFDPYNPPAFPNPVYHYDGSPQGAAFFNSPVPMPAGSTISFKFIGPSLGGLNNVSLIDRLTPTTTPMVATSNNKFNINSGSATLDGSAISSGTTLVPLDDQEHTIVYTSGTTSTFNSVGGNATLSGSTLMPIYDIVMNTGSTVYNWPCRDNAQSMVETNFGSYTLTISSAYKADRWY